MEVVMSKGMTTFFNRVSKGQKIKILRNILLLIPGIAAEFIIHSGLIENTKYLHLLIKLDSAYMVAIAILIGNSLLIAFMEVYNKSEKSRYRPLKSLIQAIQVISVFIGGIVIASILIDKSPTALLTGLGASAAVLMLVFKDSILGLVAGVQLSQNNMIHIGDWIQMPDSGANGVVEEITLNTVKVRNWDNTITTIPPYTLVSQSFKNWRGMQESGGRRVDKMIYIDLKSIGFCSQEQIAEIKKLPLMSSYKPSRQSPATEIPTNSQLYRVYIERYLRQHPKVAQNLDLIIAQRQPGEFGVPIEVYFFVTDKMWDEYEKIQSDIFDHLLAMASDFGLKLYQLPG